MKAFGKWSVVLGVVVVGLAIAITMSRRTDTSAPGAQAKPEVEITIAQAGDFYLYAPLYIAADKGYFKTNGIAVRIVSTGGDEKTWAAVLGGSAQFGVADPTFIAVASQRGKPGVIVGTIVNGVPFWGITKDASTPEIKTPADLKGHTVATFPAPSTAYTLQKLMFEKAGLEPSIRQSAFGTLLSVLEAKQADIALELEPNVSQALTKGYRVLYSLADVYGDFTITGITCTPEYLDKHRDVVAGVVGALGEAMAFIHSQPDAAAEILATRFPEVDPSVAKSALKRVLDSGVIPQSPVVNRDAWLKALQLRVDAGDLAKPVDPMVFIRNIVQ